MGNKESHVTQPQKIFMTRILLVLSACLISIEASCVLLAHYVSGVLNVTVDNVMSETQCANYLHEKIGDSVEFSVENVSKNGIVGLLDIWAARMDMEYDERALELASANGHVAVLNWWKASKLPLKYDETAFDLACQNGHVHVLDWWLQSGLKIKYSSYAMTFTKSVRVLEWMKKNVDYFNWHESGVSLEEYIRVVDVFGNANGLKLLYREESYYEALKNGNIDVVEWWFKSGLEINCESSVILYAAMNVNSLKWWSENYKYCNWHLYAKTLEDYEKLFYSYDHVAMDRAPNRVEFSFDEEYFAVVDVAVLDWLLQSGHKLPQLGSHVMDSASSDGRADILQWLKENLAYFDWQLSCTSLEEYRDKVDNQGYSNGRKLAYSSRAIHEASRNGKVHVLAWWGNSRLPLRFNLKSMPMVPRAKVWWKKYYKEMLSRLEQ